MRIGYVRAGSAESGAMDAVSTMEASGCARVVIDSVSRNSLVSEVFSGLVSRMEAGDTLVVVNLNHITGSLRNLLECLVDLEQRGIRLETLSAELDTSEPAVAAVVRTFREFVHRGGHTREGRPVSRASIVSGRPRRLLAEDIAHARKLLENEGRTVQEVARELGVSRATLYRSLRSNDS